MAILSSFYNLVLKLLLIKTQDISTGSQSNNPDGVYTIWLKLAQSSISVQAVILLVVVAALYRWVFLPYAQDYFLAERCRFSLVNLEPLQAGDSVVFTISGFLPTVNLGSEEVGKHTKDFFNALIVKVLLKEERVPVMKAYAEDVQGSIKIIFSVEKSGTYTMIVKYNGFVIPGSPIEIHIPPESMCADFSEVKLPCTPLLLTDGMPQAIEIYPRDRTGHACSAEGVRIDKFDFHASTERSCCNVQLCSGKTCEFLSGYWKEGLDAGFKYKGNAVANDQSRTESQIAVILNLRTNRSPNSYGIFEGQICYDKQLVKCFPIVSLRREEYERLAQNLIEPKPTDVIQLKAEILQPATNDCNKIDEPKKYSDWYVPKAQDDAVPGKSKEVHLNVSLKFICVKEVVWTVLLSRTALFSIQGGTKIVAVPETDEKQRYIVTISDEIGNDVRLLMYASSTRMLMALFLKFRASTTGTELCFLEKASNFFEALNLHCKRLMPFQRENFELLNISKPDVLRTSHEATKSFDKAQWYTPFVVSFLREPLLENDEAWLEWAELVLDTVLENNPNGMFHRISESSGFIHPNPSRNFRRWSLQYYELTGKVVGKYMVERSMNTRSLNYRVKVRFSRSFLLQLIGSKPTANSLERDMPELYESTLRTLTKSNFDDGVLTFCVPVYDSYGKLDQMIPLMENGEQILVTNDNAELYLNALAGYHLSYKVSKEIAAFRAGFTFVVPEDFLLNFDENELELLICGWSKLDLTDMKNNHEVIGENWHPEFHRILKWFWRALENMSTLEHAQLLQFATGSSVLPLGGFSQLNPRLSLSMTCIYGQLPVADSSAHKICISDHPDHEAFTAALLAAIRRSACCQDKPKVLECVHIDRDKVNSNSIPDFLDDE